MRPPSDYQRYRCDTCDQAVLDDCVRTQAAGDESLSRCCRCRDDVDCTHGGEECDDCAGPGPLKLDTSHDCGQRRVCESCFAAARDYT